MYLWGLGGLGVGVFLLSVRVVQATEVLLGGVFSKGAHVVVV